MKKWEYQTKYFGGHEIKSYKINEYLNYEGKEGWELVDIIIKHMINDPMEVATYTFIFKRENRRRTSCFLSLLR